MSAKYVSPVATHRRWLVAMILLGVAGPGFAQSLSKQSPLVMEAEKLFAKDKGLEAEPLYKKAIESASNKDRHLCYDRLLTIYALVGRHDKAVQTIVQYQTWLKKIADLGRYDELNLELGRLQFALGHANAAAAPLRAYLKSGGRVPLPTDRQLNAEYLLARIAEEAGRDDEAKESWRRVGVLARTLLAKAELPPSQRASIARQIAESLRFFKNYPDAVALLSKTAAEQGRRNDRLGQRDTLRLMADIQRTAEDFAKAEATLIEAYALYPVKTAEDRLSAGEMAVALGNVCQTQNRQKDAAKWRQEAADHFQAVLDKKVGVATRDAMSAFWNLQRLFQSSSQYRKALQLASTQAEQWAGNSLLTPRLKAEQGGLELRLGSFGAARDLLRDAVVELGAQNPPNLVDLPRALNNLAVVELATDDLANAQKHGKQCLDLYERYGLRDDLLKVDAISLVGTCAAQDGDYARAISRYREGLTICERLGKSGDSHQSNLLLNIALLLKSQGDAPEAMRFCKQAEAVYRRVAAPNDLGFAAFNAAFAGMYAGQGKIREANAYTGRILELCGQHQITQGPLVVTAKHCQAMHHLAKREFGPAEMALQEVLAIQEKDRQTVLVPRTLNYLGLAALLQNKPADAEAYLRRAEKLQKNNPRSFPATHFISLWLLAETCERTGKHADVNPLMDDAIEIVEKARLSTYGDAQQRASFFAQFEPGFEYFVNYNVGRKQFDTAFSAAMRGRSRTLLDQLQLAGLDPRKDLRGTPAETLLSKEADLKREMSALRARTNLLGADSLDSEQAKKLLAAFDVAQAEYAANWREIVNASPSYRALTSTDLSRNVLSVLREKVVTKDTLVLAYLVGKERSYAFLVGGPTGAVEIFPLSVDAAVAARAIAPDPMKTETLLASARGLAVKKSGAPAPVKPTLPMPAKRPVGPTKPLTYSSAGALVDQYRMSISDPEFAPTRGFALRPADPAKPPPTQRFDLLGDAFVPLALRERIRTLAPKVIMVVPDGPLHRVPLEAFVLEAGPKPRYVMDELPPLVYAPSAATLAYITQRERTPRQGSFSLLTVGNPAYPQPKDQMAFAASRDLALLQGQLSLLPYSGHETKNIRALFDEKHVVALEGKVATKKKVFASIADKSIVHFAVHGFADDRFGNLFGALALAPPSEKGASVDDGFLSLHEIYNLPLKKCELAVLSACVTNAGPQQPLEAGVTLASGFLSAGAQRVVASHWSVDDASTAHLMETFLAEVTDSARQGRTIQYAQALHAARQKIRAEGRWAAPFYWAPFVLVGPAN